MKAGEKNAQQLLDEFEAARGQQFRVVGHKETSFCTGTNLVDKVVGVDRKYETVIGEKYGDFHVSLVQLKNQQQVNKVPSQMQLL